MTGRERPDRFSGLTLFRWRLFTARSMTRTQSMINEGVTPIPNDEPKWRVGVLCWRTIAAALNASLCFQIFRRTLQSTAGKYVASYVSRFPSERVADSLFELNF